MRAGKISGIYLDRNRERNTMYPMNSVMGRVRRLSPKLPVCLTDLLMLFDSESIAKLVYFSHPCGRPTDTTGVASDVPAGWRSYASRWCLQSWVKLPGSPTRASRQSQPQQAVEDHSATHRVVSVQSAKCRELIGCCDALRNTGSHSHY